MRAELVIGAVVALLGVCLATAPDRGCSDQYTQSLPFCDITLDMDSRVRDLLNRLTLTEKIALISSSDPQDPDWCSLKTASIPRLGIPEHMWLTETTDTAGSACYGPDKCATSFNGDMGIGASFNRTSWRYKGIVVGNELRALHNLGWTRYLKPFGHANTGVTGFGPNVNIYLDPRYGRNSELPGEDPFLSGTYAVEYTQGMQEVDENGFYKMRSFLKHYSAYNVETNRFHYNAHISLYDWFDTHLPAFEMALTNDHPSSGVMCSYNSADGVPSCASNFLLREVLRKKWNRPDALVLSDCGAVGSIRGDPVNAQDDVHAGAYALMNGTDIEAGGHVWVEGGLQTAINKNLATEHAVDEAVYRALLQRFKAGTFDPPKNVKWTNLGVEEINSTWNQQVAFEAGLQSAVLLKNKDSTLPLKVGSKVAVVGPQAAYQYGMLADYFGDEVCYAGRTLPNERTWDCIKTFADSITEINGAETKVVPGIPLQDYKTDGAQAAFDAINDSDVVVMVLGIDRTMEGEGADRSTMALPAIQQWFAKQVFSLGKPTVLVLVNAGQLIIDDLIEPSAALVEAFNPGIVGAKAISHLLFGLENKWGKLPVTIYPASYEKEISVTDMSITTGPGRTYRYYKGKPLFTFGTGLSLTDFKLNSCAQTSVDSGVINFECSLSNTGSRTGDEVIMVFHQPGQDVRDLVNGAHPVPLKKLVEFQRVTLDSGSTDDKIKFSISRDSLRLVNQNGDRVHYAGSHKLIFSRGYADDEVIHEVSLRVD